MKLTETAAMAAAWCACAVALLAAWVGLVRLAYVATGVMQGWW